LLPLPSAASDDDASAITRTTMTRSRRRYGRAVNARDGDNFAQTFR
jgi:hypothetical protein